MNNTVAKPNNPDPMDAGDEVSAQADDLDSILNSLGEEFDSDTNKADTAQPKDEDTMAQFKAFMQQQQSKEAVQDVDSATDTVMSYLGDDVKTSKKIVRGLLKDMADSNNKFDQAFQNRHQSPDSWDKVLKGAAKTISKEITGISAVDDQLTNDRASVAATVAGKSIIADDDSAPDYTKMTDSEFNKYKQGIPLD